MPRLSSPAASGPTSRAGMMMGRLPTMLSLRNRWARATGESSSSLGARISMSGRSRVSSSPRCSTESGSDEAIAVRLQCPPHRRELCFVTPSQHDAAPAGDDR